MVALRESSSVVAQAPSLAGRSLRLSPPSFKLPSVHSTAAHEVAGATRCSGHDAGQRRTGHINVNLRPISRRPLSGRALHQDRRIVHLELRRLLAKQLVLHRQLADLRLQSQVVLVSRRRLATLQVRLCSREKRVTPGRQRRSRHAQLSRHRVEVVALEQSYPFDDHRRLTQKKNKAGNGGKGREPSRSARARSGRCESARQERGRRGLHHRADPASGGARGRDETKASASQGQGGLGGGGREEPARREVMAELGEALLGGLAGGVDGDDAPAAAAGAAQDGRSGQSPWGRRRWERNCQGSGVVTGPGSAKVIASCGLRWLDDRTRQTRARGSAKLIRSARLG